MIFKRFIPFSIFALTACAAPLKPPAPILAVTAVPQEQATPEYWYDQPATATAISPDFQPLWDACGDVARDDLFTIDLTDYRQGVLTTQPMISKQFFEPWRSDAGDFGQVMQDSLQTIRRTLRFEVSRTSDGSYAASPKVLVEQLSQVTHRITTVAEYRFAFMPLSPDQLTQPATDGGSSIPVQYWHALGRDYAMERELVHAIQEKIR